MFEIPIQAAVGNKIIARENVRAMRKDVLAKCYGGDITRDKEKQKKEKATEDLERFTDMIMKRQTGVKDLVIGRWPKINSRLIGSFFVKHLITDKPFHVTEDLCIRCGKCAEACPVNDIIWSKGSMPKWKHNGSCLSCFACYHHCPKHAIEYGGRTKNKGQYFFEKNERR